ncbi:hypothetical protein N7495_006281 [Penicillium taxi]|uniref:uncharacterized protein n=1 Tax=Penicillium taxi TaxID=168475 RepID=UPI0025452572|nr:uncharacterized protein N7495_006281 [Penicillium taxi]KAJ5894590.1 hypothetical protein N7495_006281 [Penicillium taxi]
MDDLTTSCPLYRSMTTLPSPPAQSTLSEKAVIYLDHVTENIPILLDSLRPRLAPLRAYLSTTPFRSVAQVLPFEIDETTATIFAALTVALLTVSIMSWNSFSSFWRSPAPQVSDADFSYITPDDIVEPPSNASLQDMKYIGSIGDSEPDVINVRHRGKIYPLQFRAYAIDDGLLTVGHLRREAALQLGAENPKQVRLLYKGTILADDSRSCKASGLKQHSEVLCVVSSADHAAGPSDNSDSSAPREVAEPSTKKKKNNKKKGNKKKNAPVPETIPPGPPVASSQPLTSPNLKLLPTAMEQVTALTQYLIHGLLPLCQEYITDPPTDAKKREFEHKKLSETILAQVMLKADSIEPDGNVQVRTARKDLIRKAQETLNELDSVAKEG